MEMKIDMHVHIVGNGTGGTGCWLRSGGWRTPIEMWMLKTLGLPMNAMRGDLDALVVSRLREWIRTSSIDAAVILAQDEVYDESGSRMEGLGSFYVPNDYVLELGRKYPEFLPAVSIHPARKDAMDELEKCLAGGARMMKLLPNCLNIDCNRLAYKPFWKKMAEAGLPLLAHTGGEMTVPQVNPAYADPRTLELPLACGVKVVAAHTGTRSLLRDPDYMDVLEEMMGRYPHLYCDNSALNTPFRSAGYEKCLQEPFVSRMVHGSDFPVLVYAHWAWIRGLMSWEDYLYCESTTNFMEKDFRIKRVLGFPDQTFTRIHSILRGV